MNIIDQAITLLNEAYALDPDAINKLINYRVTCNTALSEHPTIQVGLNDDGSFRVGLLGILNGIFGIKDDGYGFIGASINKEDGSLTGFVKLGDSI